MILVGFWKGDAVPGNDAPYALYWGDGRDATLDDYNQHFDDTHEDSFESGGRIIRRFYPHIVGGVRWDFDKEDWRVSGKHITPFYLKLDDPSASDHRIWVELTTFPRVYRCEVIRPSGSPWPREHHADFMPDIEREVLARYASLASGVSGGEPMSGQGHGGSAHV